MWRVQRKNQLSLYFYSFLILASLPAFVFSQITITQPEFLKLFTPGNPLYAVPGESGLINVGKREGPNVYDFSFVGALNEFTMTNYEVSQIPELSGRYPSTASTFGGGLQNIDGSPVFLSVSDSTFLLGDVTIADEYRFVHYMPYELFAQFPLNFGYLPQEQPFNVYDTTYNSAGQIISTYFYNDFVDVEIYGYGTLKLPGRELDCLRMIRRYTWFQFKEFSFLTKEGVLVVVSNVALTEPDTGYVNGDYIVLSSDPITSMEDGREDMPLAYGLSQNYPNPFNPLTTIEYQIPKTSHVELSIYNILSEKVATLVSSEQAAGVHKVAWDATGFPTGIYFYRIVIDKEFSQSKKIVLIK